PRAGGDLPRAGAEVERELPRVRGGGAGRARAREPPAAEGAAGRELVRPAARARRGVRLSARRPGRLRGRPPPGGAARAALLPAARSGRGGAAGGSSAGGVTAARRSATASVEFRRALPPPRCEPSGENRTPLCR